MTRIKATIQQSATTKAAITTEGSKLVPKNILIGNFNADDVGLGNVTNESKTTMFTSPTFSGTVTITKSGTAVADAPQLILKDTDGTNETTHIYNHSGRTAIVSRNESANGIIDFIQDDGSTHTAAIKISS